MEKKCPHNPNNDSISVTSNFWEDMLRFVYEVALDEFERVTNKQTNINQNLKHYI